MAAGASPDFENPTQKTTLVYSKHPPHTPPLLHIHAPVLTPKTKKKTTTMRSFIAIAVLAAVVVSATPQGSGGRLVRRSPQGFEGQRSVANPPGFGGRFSCFQEGDGPISCCDGSGECVFTKRKVKRSPQGFEGQRAVANPPGVPGRFTCFEEDGREGISCCDGSGECADAALIADNDQNEPREDQCVAEPVETPDTVRSSLACSRQTDCRVLCCDQSGECVEP